VRSATEAIKHCGFAADHPAMRSCTRCRTAIPIDASFCPQCGAPALTATGMPVRPAFAPPAPPPLPRPTRPAVSAVAFAPVASPNGCRGCGATPAINVAFRQTIGLVLLVRMKTYRTRACRTCGLALGREVTGKSMVTGWLGIVAPIVNVVFLANNARQMAKLRSLPAPVRVSAQTVPPKTA
jgi:RNA polymerase subunit RPABC4/transcription elongation factor Spt4